MMRHGTPSPPPFSGRSDREVVRERGAHQPVSKIQRSHANALRHDMIDAEQYLWASLRAHRLNGLSFRRQTPIGSFIVDFACHGHRLVTEIDGGQNAESKCGAERDRWLASNSYRVLRFWNTRMLQNRERVLQAIINAAREQAPLPNPPPQGRRQRANASGGAQ